MVLTKSELIVSLRDEVRILLHLASKIDRTWLDYRPTSKQRSTLELLRYLSVMGPELSKAAKAGAFDPAGWGLAVKAAETRDFDETLRVIAAQPEILRRRVGRDTRCRVSQGNPDIRPSGDARRLPRQVRARWACGIPHAVVSLSEGVRPR